jgi:hypothetical protein
MTFSKIHPSQGNDISSFTKESTLYIGLKELSHMYWKQIDSNFWVGLIMVTKQQFFHFGSFIIKNVPKITEDNWLGNTTPGGNI